MVIFITIWIFAGAAICIVVAVAGNRQGAQIALAQIAHDDATLCAKLEFPAGSTTNAACVNDINALFRRDELMHSSEF